MPLSNVSTEVVLARFANNGGGQITVAEVEFDMDAAAVWALAPIVDSALNTPVANQPTPTGTGRIIFLQDSTDVAAGLLEVGLLGATLTFDAAGQTIGLRTCATGVIGGTLAGANTNVRAIVWILS
jgi:hypothetical protein